MLDIQIHPKISAIPASQWNALVKDNNPLLKHEFLYAMELHECVGEKFGWEPCHIAIYDNAQLVAAMPLYFKYNNYGEFVFDHAWADAYSRSGMNYYPKLVSAVPYTPAHGQRMLLQPERQAELQQVLLNTLKTFCDKSSSSFHILFADADQQDFFEQQGLLSRNDCQYHWFNRNYNDFDDFMQTLISRKRKNIRRERQAVIDAGVSIRQLNGHSASQKDWQDFTGFYNRTFEEKWGMATFNQPFFEHIASTLPDNILLVLADNAKGECIAGSLMYVSDTTLYGRHWGCIEQVDQLHFEACYYQGIEFCIKHHINKFEPGAQGEHKIARGFVPTLTRSAHYLTDQRWLPAIDDFCRQERSAVAEYIKQQQQKIPYRQ